MGKKKRKKKKYIYIYFPLNYVYFPLLQHNVSGIIIVPISFTDFPGTLNCSCLVPFTNSANNSDLIRFSRAFHMKPL